MENQFLMCSYRSAAVAKFVNLTSQTTLHGVRLKSGSETLLLNVEGYGGVASSALLYYQITRPTKL
jgi:hypothetical protein